MDLTPSQTVGPFFWNALCERPGNELARDGIRIAGRVFDGAAEPVPDAMVEIWQAGADGAYRSDFGWGRCGTDRDGAYSFATIKPGRVGDQAPHLEVLVFARGLLKPVLTRMYFPGEPANAADPVLVGLAEAERATLVGTPDGDGIRFDVRLQGDRQTVFFAL
jgi:protocatechuate 3,4-dioxygenase, alpha subunit